ncbi:MAG: adenine deaminase [Desulfovibrio sp.]
MPDKEIIAYARGEKPVDLLVKNIKLVNVLSGEIYEESVAVANGLVVGFGDYEADVIIDGEGKYLAPALIDGHIHIESSHLSPSEFCEVVAAHGTGAVVSDPHEIANALGVEGIDYMVEETEDLPVAVYYQVPSCVPATHMENAGATLTADDIEMMWNRYPHRLPGLAEVMNVPGVLFGDEGVHAKLQAAEDEGRIIDGHSPLLRGKDLSAYICAGPKNDHESTDPDEGLEKLRKGMHLLMREGSSEHNMKDLLPVLNDYNSQNISFISDDRHASDLLNKGHMDHSVRTAIAEGVPALRAIQMASINTARHFGLDGHGAVAPNYRADFVLLNDLDTFDIHEVFLSGAPVSQLSFEPETRAKVENTMNVAKISADTFAMPEGEGKIRVIGLIENQILTEHLELDPKMEGARPVADEERDILKLAVLERHHGSGNCGLGFVQGLGLKNGALASSYAHDSHNLIVAGTSDANMELAAKHCVKIGGGFVAVQDGKVIAELPLPIAGMMSDKPAAEVVKGLDALHGACHEMGSPLADPFMALSFLSLPVIPSLRVTDMGLVDVNKFDFTDVFVK